MSTIVTEDQPEKYVGGIVNPAYVEWQRKTRANDILTVLGANRDQHLDSKELIRKAAEAFPDRWTTYFRSSRTMASCVQTAIRDILKAHGDVLDVREGRYMPRAKRGGMGRCQRWNEYKLKG